MKPVRIYTTALCPFCHMAKRLLQSRGVPYEEVAVDNDPEQRAEMTRLSGGYTVPQIFIGDQPVGGCDDLHALDARGELQPLLADSQ